MIYSYEYINIILHKKYFNSSKSFCHKWLSFGLFLISFKTLLFCVLTGLCIAVAMQHSIKVQLLRPFRNSGAVRGRQSHGVFIKHTGKGRLFRVRLRRPSSFIRDSIFLQLRCRYGSFRCSYAVQGISFSSSLFHNKVFQYCASFVQLRCK